LPQKAHVSLLCIVRITSIDGTHTNGFSANNVVPAAIDLVAYKPFPLVDVLTTNDSGTVRLGVGLEVAVEEDTYTSRFDKSFLSRCN
jgi:hypothetical protein